MADVGEPGGVYIAIASCSFDATTVEVFEKPNVEKLSCVGTTLCRGHSSVQHAECGNSTSEPLFESVQNDFSKDFNQHQANVRLA